MKSFFPIAIVMIWFSHLANAQEEIAQPESDQNAKSSQLVNNWLAKQDSNQDGKIALDESTGLMKLNFRRNDADRDGFLDRAELEGIARGLFGNANRNRQPSREMSDAQLRQRVPQGVIVELNISYRDGNDAWKLDLAMPEASSDRLRPAIVFVHGGGWVNGDKRKSSFIQPTLQYAAKGYVCMSVNYRLDSSKLPCVQDVKCAVRWLRAHADKYSVDPNRIGAYGNSAGAHLVAMLGVSHKEKRLEGDGPWQDFSSAVQAVVAAATPTSPNLRGGSEEDKRLIAPLTYVSEDAPPFLLFHEKSDRIVDVSNSDEFVKALKQAGAKDVTYKRYTDGSGHGVFLRNIRETGPAMEAFFARTIGAGVTATK